MSESGARAQATRLIEENILKTIKLLIFQRGYAHVSDLSTILNINSNTMYVTLNKMVDKGLVEPLTPRGGKKVRRSLALTEEGERQAADVLARHQLVQEWLIRLGLPEEQADQEACNLEHGITDTVMEVLKRHVEMASRHMGRELSAEEIMRQKNEDIDESQDSTITARVMKMIERVGGLEGAERKYRVSDKAGGDDALERLVDQAVRCGGVEESILQLEAVEHIRKLAKSDSRKATKLGEIGPMINVDGHESDFAALAKNIRSYGGLKQLLHDWSNLVTLQKLSKRVGGVRVMKEVTAELDNIGGLAGLRKVSSMVKSFEDPGRFIHVLARSMRPLIQELHPESEEKKAAE